MSILKTLSFAAITSIASVFSAGAGTVDFGNPSGGDCTYGCVSTLQQIYDADAFGASAVNISSITNFAYGGTYSGSYDVFLSTTNRSVETISRTFADNRGDDVTLFASFTLSGNYARGDLVSFAGSFDYDPTAGDLLVEWVRTSATNRDYFLSNGRVGGSLSRAFSFNEGGSVYTTQDYGLATRFETGEISAVPLPAGFPMLLAGVAGFALIRRRQSA